MVQSNVVIKSLLWKVGERVFVQGVGLLVQVILTRLLMPEDFACLAIITAIVNYLGLFVQGGLAVAVVQKKDFTQKDVSTLTLISLFAAMIMYVCLFFAASFYQYPDSAVFLQLPKLVIITMLEIYYGQLE